MKQTKWVARLNLLEQLKNKDMHKLYNGMDKGTQTYTENEVYEMLKQDVIYHD